MRLIRWTLVISGLSLLLIVGLLVNARRHPSNAYWLLVSHDEGSQQQLAKLSPGGGRLFPITPKWRAFLVLDNLADDEWLYLAHYPGQYDADGRERAELIRVNRADLHYESFGWLSVSEGLIPMPDGDWLVVNVSYQTTGFYRLRRDGTGRELMFRLDDPALSIPSHPIVVFSADGQWMYFMALDNGPKQMEIFRVRLDGTQLSNLTADFSANAKLERVLPDEDWLIFWTDVADNHLWKMRGDGSGLGPVAGRVDGPSTHWVGWLASQRLIVVISDVKENGPLLAVHPENPTPVWRFERIGSYSADLFQISPDQLLVRDNRGVSIVHDDGRSHLIYQPRRRFSFRVGQSSEWVYFAEVDLTSRLSTVWRADVTTFKPERILHTFENFGLSGVAPDGSWLVFVGGLDQHYGLYRAKADGSGLFRLTDNIANPAFVDFGPSINMDWSPVLLIVGGVMIGLGLPIKLLRGAL